MKPHPTPTALLIILALLFTISLTFATVELPYVIY
jgi:hypothetical protein